MGKFFKKCGICLVEKTKKIWFPFRRDLLFSEDSEDIDDEDSIQICQQCISLIFEILRANGEAFSECITIGDFANVVRKVGRL